MELSTWFIFGSQSLLHREGAFERRPAGVTLFLSLVPFLARWEPATSFTMRG